MAVLVHAAFNNQAEAEVESSHNQSFSLQNPCVAKKEICQTLNFYASFISICSYTCFYSLVIASLPCTVK